ncbi:complement component C1q receptor [Chanos chanos]|uniref:Complement component C1q receptor n=1 Tax=Chanos chanos TaxID=29144 RepID=A0A6J2WD83_CHACN|nr:complement component C1q receptor-like [Chanos chanos]
MLRLLPLFYYIFIVRGNSSPDATLCTANVCFTLHLVKVSFHVANQQCLGNGGKLVTVRDIGELGDLKSVLLLNKETYTGSGNKFWIGLRLHKGNCTISGASLHGFKWVSGVEESSYSNWKKPPRSTCIGDRCVAVENPDLKWTDISCNNKAFYVCKFLFKGMCSPLLLDGPGEISYNPPFSSRPLAQDLNLTMLPYGTIADIHCSDQTIYSVCKDLNGVLLWTNSGPFCASGKQSCRFNNGGCHHLCEENEATGVICKCRDGYALGDDKMVCSLRDYCLNSPCKHKCESTSTGFYCACPEGLELDSDKISCTDVDECLENACGDHDCLNTLGSYKCHCREGYQMINGKCEDIDECTESRCQQGCLNSEGSFSCYCLAGFGISPSGQLCEDIDECLDRNVHQCEDMCVNTLGSYICSCKQNFRLAENGITCVPDPTAESSVNCEQNKNADGCDEVQNVPHVTSLYPQSPNSTELDYSSLNTAKENIPYKTSNNTGASVPRENYLNNNLFLICVLGSAIPLFILVGLTLVIVMCRWNRSRKNSKKKIATADGYCWVSSGLEAHMNKD